MHMMIGLTGRLSGITHLQTPTAFDCTGVLRVKRHPSLSDGIWSLAVHNAIANYRAELLSSFVIRRFQSFRLV